MKNSNTNDNMNKNKYQKHILAIILLFLLLIIWGCNKTNNEVNNEPITRTAFALDTIISITIYDSKDETVLNGAIDLVEHYELVYSKTLVDSELFKLNNRTLTSIGVGPYTYQISDELSELLEYGLEYSSLSNGAFDITIEPLSSLWDFKAKEAKVPDSNLISEAVKKTGYKNVKLDGNIIDLGNEDTRIELGAIAKGYIADRVKDYLLEEGVKSAIIDLGGNILCLGEKDGTEPFKVGIQKPFAGRNELIATMDIKDMSVVTSGIYERYFIKDDKTFHHILDPTTGYSYDNNLLSITVIAEKSSDADGLSTTCFALGLEEGMKLINTLENTYAIFIDKDYEFHYSEAFHDDINVNYIETP